MKIREWFNTEWIGKATLAGLKAAIEDLDYTWGVPEGAFDQAKTPNPVQEAPGYQEKLAA